MDQRPLYRLQYMPQLDSLRCLAAMGVFVQHFLPDSPLGPIPLGDLGVRLFFVLSGFLITLVILDGRANVESRGMSSRGMIWRFYARRFLRLIPVYYLVITLCFIVLPEPRQHAGWFYLYLQNLHYAAEGHFTMAAHLWTLAIEEQFYFVWPFLILFLSRERLWRAIVFVVVSGIIARIAFMAFGLSHFQASMLTPSHLDSLGIGALLAVSGYKYADQPDIIDRALSSCFCLGLSILGIVFVAKIYGLWSGIEFILGEIGASLFFVWVIGRAAKGFEGPIGGILNRPTLIYLGKISYGLYVYHVFVPDLLRYFLKGTRFSLPSSDYLQLLLFSAVSIVIAMISWHFMEKPILAMKDRFSFSGRSSSGVIHSATVKPA